jgi:2-iminobutanoate/2-iminopropanoate deaminase
MKPIHTPNAPQPIGPYSQAIQAGGFLFVSGQICADPVTGELHNASVTAETRQIMENIGAVLEAVGATFGHIVKTTIFLSDMALFQEVNEAYGRFFQGHFPARETIAVKGLPKNVNVEISVTAFVG